MAVGGKRPKDHSPHLSLSVLAESHLLHPALPTICSYKYVSLSLSRFVLSPPYLLFYCYTACLLHHLHMEVRRELTQQRTRKKKNRKTRLKMLKASPIERWMFF